MTTTPPEKNELTPCILSLPADMREYTLSRREMMHLHRLAIFSGLSVLCFTTAVVFYALLVHQVGVAHLQGHLWESLLDLWKIFCWLAPFWLVVRFFSLRAGIRKMKTVDLPIWYGFDEKGLYYNCALCTNLLRWERFSAWKEKGDYLLLHDGACWTIWPKAIWAPEEMQTLRDRLQHGVSPGPSRRKQQ